MSLTLRVFRQVRDVDESIIGIFPRDRRRETSGGWMVDNDFPLPNQGQAEELIANTVGFCLVLPEGDIVGHFKTAAEAEEARANAKVSFVAEVNTPEPPVRASSRA